MNSEINTRQRTTTRPRQQTRPHRLSIGQRHQLATRSSQNKVERLGHLQVLSTHRHRPQRITRLASLKANSTYLSSWLYMLTKKSIIIFQHSWQAPKEEEEWKARTKHSTEPSKPNTTSKTTTKSTKISMNHKNIKKCKSMKQNQDQDSTTASAALASSNRNRLSKFINKQKSTKEWWKEWWRNHILMNKHTKQASDHFYLYHHKNILLSLLMTQLLLFNLRTHSLSVALSWYNGMLQVYLWCVPFWQSSIPDTS